MKTSDIHKGAIPFMALQGVGLIIVMAVPSTVTWLVEQAGFDTTAMHFWDWLPL